MPILNRCSERSVRILVGMRRPAVARKALVEVQCRGTPGTLFRCRTCSTDGRSYRTSGRPCEVTNRIVDIVWEGRTGRGFSPDQARDPKLRRFGGAIRRAHMPRYYDSVRLNWRNAGLPLEDKTRWRNHCTIRAHPPSR